VVSKLRNLFSSGETAEDPVCHMMVDVWKALGGTYEHAGQTYYFCGPGCRVAFTKEPEVYLSGEKQLEM
jgi:Cu+-exporting ATPase